MKKFLLLALTSLFSTYTAISASPVQADSLLKVLKTEIVHKNTYDKQKDEQIAILRYKLSIKELKNKEIRYQATLDLFEAFKDYRFDSTFRYAQQLVDLSQQLHDNRRVAENRLRLGTTLISSGMFKETFDCLREIDPRLLDRQLKKSYYVLYSWAWSDISKYNADRFYAPEDLEKKFRYLDSAIALTDNGSFEQLILKAQQEPNKGPHPSRYYMELMDRKLSKHEEAMVVTGLSRYRTGDEKVRLLAIAAINDIRTSTYRAQALVDLGNTLCEQGKVNDAYFFLQQAMEQANKFGARMQRYQVARILPVVAEKRDTLARQERQRFLVLIASIVVITVITGLVGFIIFVQLKKVRAGERVIRESNRLLAQKNKLLWEEGRIKEEYIGFFFSELSRHIIKLDKLKNNVQRKVKSGGIDEALRQLDGVDIHAERLQLFHTFDQVFLKLFPDFVEAVNAMLPEEDQLKPKQAGTLTTQLRIFALMRLGVNNNEMIAAILEFTVNTVYTYRFRLRSKALVPADDFEQRIMGIQIAESAL
jgi:tetratricopeptide (TPR) repeat protein